MVLKTKAFHSGSKKRFKYHKYLLKCISFLYYTVKDNLK